MYLTTNQLAEKLQISIPTLVRLRTKGVIRGYKVGNQWRYDEDEVDEAMKGGQYDTRRTPGIR